MEYQIGKWENGEENVYVFDEFTRLNANKEPEKIGSTEFADMLNLYKDQAHTSEFIRRKGFTIAVPYALPDAVPNIIQIKELILDGNRFLIGRSRDETRYYYMPYPYIVPWVELYNSPFTFSNTPHEYVNVLNHGYVGNIIRGTYDLDDNAVIINNEGTLNKYTFGLLTDIADDYILDSDILDGQLTDEVLYYYGITVMYDGFMESNISNLKVVQMGVGENAVIIGNNIPGWGNDRMKKIKIYRSKAISIAAPEPPTVMYYVDTAEIDLTNGVWYIDRKADEDLTEQVEPSSLTEQSPPYRNRYWTSSRNRLVQGNLQADRRLYSPIPASVIELTELPTGGLSGQIKYRLSKVFIRITEEGYLFTLGEGSLDTITVSAGTHDVKIRLEFADDDFDDIFSGWTQYVAIERAIDFSPSDDYRLIAIASIKSLRAGTGITDSSPTGIMTKYNGLPFTIVDRVLIEGKSYDSPTTLVISSEDSWEKFDNSNVIIIDKVSNNAISGVFDEKNRLVVFADRNIYQIDTEAIDPAFWVTTKLVEGVGARGSYTIEEESLYRDASNGILQLPSGGGYIFFDKTYRAAGGEEILIYYWDGQSNNVTVISNEVSAIINNNNTFIAKAMRFDSVRNFVWILINNGTDLILIFDVSKKQWYKWSSGFSLLYMSDVISLLDGKIFLATNLGYIYEYNPQSDWDEIAPDSLSSFDAWWRTKTLNYSDALITGVMMKTEWDAIGAGVFIVRSYCDNVYEEATYPSQMGINRVVYRTNQPARRVYFEAIIQSEEVFNLKGLTMNVKKRNTKYG